VTPEMSAALARLANRSTAPAQPSPRPSWIVSVICKFVGNQYRDQVTYWCNRAWLIAAQPFVNGLGFGKSWMES